MVMYNPKTQISIWKIGLRECNDFSPSTIAAKLVAAVSDGGNELKIRNI
jgi:hypothetical protein